MSERKSFEVQHISSGGSCTLMKCNKLAIDVDHWQRFMGRNNGKFAVEANFFSDARAAQIFAR